MTKVDANNMFASFIVYEGEEKSQVQACPIPPRETIPTPVKAPVAKKFHQPMFASFVIGEGEEQSQAQGCPIPPRS